MSNNKESQRDILIRIDERQKIMKEDIKEMKDTYANHLKGCAVKKQLEEHKKNHKWFVTAITGGILAIMGFFKLTGK